MKTLYTFIFTAILMGGMNAQTPNIDWETNLGGSGNDYAYSIRELLGGGYVVAGYTESNDMDVSGNQGGADMWMALLDANGNLLNQFTYGGSNEDVAYDVQQTSEGGFVLAGYTLSNDGDVGGANNGDEDIWVIKTDASGVIEWETTIGGTLTDKAQSIQEIAGGKFVVVGSTISTDIGVSNHGGYDIIFLRLNNAGNPELIKLYGGSGWDYGFKVEQTQDGGYIIGGYTTSNDDDVSGNHGGIDGWALKLDANTNPSIDWQTCTGAGADDKVHDIIQHSNGSYIMAGTSGAPPNVQFFVASLQSNGAIAGQSTYGGSGDDVLYALAETTSGDYIITGNTDSNDGDVSGNHGSDDFWVADIGQWQKCLGGPAQQFANAVIGTSDGGSAVCGFSISSGGDVGGNNGGVDFWVVKLANPLSVNEFGTSSISIYPNPATSHFIINPGQTHEKNIEVSVSNLLGQNVFKSKMSGSQIQITTTDWAGGMYFVNLSDETGRKIATKKILVE